MMYHYNALRAAYPKFRVDRIGDWLFPLGGATFEDWARAFGSTRAAMTYFALNGNSADNGLQLGITYGYRSVYTVYEKIWFVTVGSHTVYADPYTFAFYWLPTFQFSTGTESRPAPRTVTPPPVTVDPPAFAFKIPAPADLTGIRGRVTIDGGDTFESSGDRV